MNTAIPANREKVCTAGMEDSAPAGREEDCRTPYRSHGHTTVNRHHFLLACIILVHFRNKTILNKLSVFNSGIRFKQNSRFVRS